MYNISVQLVSKEKVKSKMARQERITVFLKHLDVMNTCGATGEPYINETCTSCGTCMSWSAHFKIEDILEENSMTDPSHMLQLVPFFLNV